MSYWEVYKSTANLSDTSWHSPLSTTSSTATTPRRCFLWWVA